MKAHYPHPYILQPQHKLTVHLVGVGGTGTNVLSILARMNKALLALNHPGLHVRAFDPDKVSPANIGRQMFSEADLHLNKAVVAVTRINRFFGYDWEAYPEAYMAAPNSCNILITCVDTAKARLLIKFDIDYARKQREPMQRSYYWLDFGNSQTTGQAVLGTVYSESVKKDMKTADGKSKLPCITDLHNLNDIKEEDQGPSCSLAEAIGKQDLLINSTLANLGCNLLWKLFRFGKITHHGVYLNLDTLKSTPIPV